MGRDSKVRKSQDSSHIKIFLRVVIDDDNDLSPAPDVPPMLVTTTEGDNLESEEAINNTSSGINEQNTSNDDEEDQQYNKPIFIEVGGGRDDILYVPVIDNHARNFKATETQFKIFGNRDNYGKKEIPPTPEALVDHYFDDGSLLCTNLLLWYCNITTKERLLASEL